ncbi:MAG: hypothetical protein LQ342_003950 [Letrouitia transgressa]|nr:MAG: hypothetical protein LQ342_003950 [Letrouitia transgressa]
MAIHFAAESGDFQTVEKLIAALPACMANGLGRWLSKQNIYYGIDKALINALIAAEAITYYKSNRNFTDVSEYWFAGKRPWLVSRVVEKLLRWDNTPQSIPSTALFRAARGHSDFVQFLLQVLPKPIPMVVNYDGLKPLFCAAQRGWEEVVANLLDAKVDINIVADDQQTSLPIAPVHGRAGIVTLLLESSINIEIARNPDGRTALHLAAKKGHTDVV